jgi:hypothetical protein
MGLGGIPRIGGFLLLIMGLGAGAVLYVSEGVQVHPLEF